MSQTFIDFLKEDEDEPLYEMANMSTAKTGIKGTIWCSTKQGKHGCRIKYYPNLKIKSESLTVSIPDCEIVENSTDVDNFTKKLVIYFAKKNVEIFLKLWHEAPDMHQEEEQVEIWDKIKPIEPSDLSQIKQITII